MSSCASLTLMRLVHPYPALIWFIVVIGTSKWLNSQIALVTVGDNLRVHLFFKLDYLTVSPWLFFVDTSRRDTLASREMQ